MKFAALVLLATASFVHAAPNADDILRAARVNPLGENITLNAQLRAGSQKVPFQIAVKDGAISYLFTEPDQALILRLGENSATLEERRGGKTAPVAPARFDDAVRGGLLTYEDLALRFLYWPNARLLGEETLESIPCYKVEIPAPGANSRYGIVRVWIGRENGALVGIEGYDREGRLAKRFKVVTVQKLGGQWMLRQMRVERINPETRKVDGRMYLEVTGRADA